MPFKTEPKINIKPPPALQNKIFEDDLEFATIEEIRKETAWPYDYTSNIGLIPYIKRLKGEVVGIEVGTGKGESAYLFLEECPNIKRLYTIDEYKEYSNWKEVVPQENQDKAWEIAKKNLAVFGDRGVVIRCNSSDKFNLKDFKPESADFIFIDGGDSYEQTLEDFDNYYPLLKKKGIFAGHNYQLGPVRQAMMDWREKNKVRNPINRVTNWCYFWNK